MFETYALEIQFQAVPLISTHWIGVLGTLASIFGAILTVYYARQARDASLDAKESAKNMRLNMIGLDTIGTLHLIESQLNELCENIIQEDWLEAYRSTIQIRNNLVKLSMSKEIYDNSISHKKIDSMRDVVSQISEKTTKIHYNKIKAPNHSHFINIISAQIETIAEMHRDTRTVMETRDVG